MQEYSQILNADEKILWEGAPQLAPFVVKTFAVIPFGLLFLSFSVFWMFSAASGGAPIFFTLFGLPFVLTGLGMSFTPLYPLLVHKKIHYVITDKRIIIQGGLIGRDYEVVDFDKIQSSYVTVGIADKLFGHNSGSILIDAGRMKSRGENGGSASHPYAFNSITDPYKVFEFFKKVSFDVKTDIEYPNQLRPANNPGYSTGYTPEKIQQN